MKRITSLLVGAAIALLATVGVAHAGDASTVLANVLPAIDLNALGLLGIAFGGLIHNASIRSMMGKKADAVGKMRALSDQVAAENRDFTEAEAATFAGYQADVARLAANIKREEALVLEEAGLNASGQPTPGRHVRVEVDDNREADPRRGFRHAGEFFAAVRANPGSDVLNARDERLQIGAAAPSTGANESSGADGGFLIPPDFSREIWMHSLGEESLIPLTDNTNITGNSMVFPKDETTPWGSDGVQVNWQAELTAAGATKPKLGTNIMLLKKLIGLVPMSDELVADQNALNTYLPKKLGTKIRWKTNEAILFGAGNGTPVGALNANAMVIQAKESGQATLTLVPLNLANMIARLPPGSYGNAIWVINNNVLPALFTLTLGNYPIYLPGAASVGGMQMNPYGTLLGRPIMVSQHAKSFTSQGDVCLVDLSYYRTITKAGGIETATSMHLYFDADAMAFRVTFRMDGESTIVNPINPANGSTTLSPFIQLAAR